MESVLITGATGAVGRRVPAALPARFTEVCCLVRPGGESRLPQDDRIRVVTGDLLHPESWASALDGVTTVLHLAASTGKAGEAEHMRVNRDGTELLVRAAEAAGVSRLVFVSSIAARFRDLRHYPYGEAKRQAERIVTASRLEHVIVRPTQVVAPGSGAFEGLNRLVRRGWVIVPGDGRAPVQPIHVDDLVALLVTLIGAAPPDEPVEAGGPEATTMEDLLRRLHAVRFGGSARTVHLPLGPITALLAALERIAGDAAPAKPGQFAAFREDGAARASALLAAARPRMMGIDAMLRDATRS